MKLRYFILILCGLSLWLSPPSAKAQGQQSAILFSGYVIDGRTEQPLQNCSVLIHRAGRGVSTNGVGYFAIPVYPGDTIVFRYLGYKHQYHLIPKITTETYSAVIELKEDAKLLQEVKVKLQVLQDLQDFHHQVNEIEELLRKEYQLNYLKILQRNEVEEDL